MPAAFLLGRRLRLVGQMDDLPAHRRARVSHPAASGAAVMGSECRGRAPAASPARHGAGRWCRRAKPLTRGFGERPRMSMQRDMPLPRIQPAHGWSGVERRNAFRRGVGRESLTVDATGHAVAAHPIRAGLGKVAGTGPGSSSWVHGGRESPSAREGCNGRAKRLPCQACCVRTTHRLPYRNFRQLCHLQSSSGSLPQAT